MIKLKIIVAGAKDVGKTSLIRRFVNGIFQTDTIGTIGVDFMTKRLNLGSNEIRLSLWDFAGEKRFSSLLPSYATGSSAAIFMCDISKRDSINNIDKWLLTFNEGLNSRDPKFPLIIVGGKLDLEENRSLDKKDIEAVLTVRKEFDYLECSSKTGENVDLLFQILIDKMLIYGNIQPPTR